MSYDIRKTDIIQDQIDDIVLELIKARKRSMITQTELSVRANVPQTTISRIESLRTIPTLQMVLKLSNALGLSLYFVFYPFFGIISAV